MANRRGRGGGGGIKASERADTAPPSEAGTHVVDLNSRSATHIASIVFLPVRQHNLPIIQFEVRDCLLVCEQFRDWLQTAGTPETREVVRIDDIELNLIAPHTKGNIFFLEGAATLEGNANAPVSIFALHVPTNKHVRYLWTPLSPSPLLTDLAIRELIGPPMIHADQFKPTFSPTGVTLPPYHHTLYTVIAQCFENATKYPDSPEMVKATRISDVCPSILDPDTAYQRVDAIDDLHSSKDPNANGKDLSDDRYIHELHPAERQLASLLYVGCAEYLLIKRTYFKAFSRETVLHAAKVRRAAASTRNFNRAASTQQIEVKEEDEEDEGEEGDADADKENEDPPAEVLPAPVPPAPVPRTSPSTTRPRTRARQATDQQNVIQAAPDDKQKDEEPAADNEIPRAAPTTARSRTRSQRASNQQNANPAVPLASIEQTDVIMKDTEDDEGEQNDQPAAAATPVPRVTRSGVRTRQSTANPLANSVATQDVKPAVPLAGTEQNDVTMKDNEGDDDKKSEDLPADTSNLRVTRSGARTVASVTSVAPVATQNVHRAAPLAGTEKMDVKMKDHNDDGDKANDDSPAGSPNKRAAPPTARSRGRRTRQSTVDLTTADDDKGNDESSGPADSLKTRAVVRSRGRRTRGPAAKPPTRVVKVAKVAPPIDSEEIEDDNEANNTQSDATPAPTASPTPRATPAATIGTVQAHAGTRRQPRTAAELAASRSNAAAVGAINRRLRVRTVNRHIRTLEEQAGFTYRRAYKWMAGWDALGFLDEERVLAVQEGEDNDGDGEWSE
jgi:hypothetical protein